MEITCTYTTTNQHTSTKKTTRTTHLTIDVEMDIQVPPSEEKDKNGFVKVTACQRCGRTAAYTDQTILKPCPNCGGNVEFVEKGAMFHVGAWYIAQ